MTKDNREIEAKFYVRDLKAIEVRVISLNAKTISTRAHEINLRFDTPALDLKRAGRVLRLRRDDEIRLTYKEAGKLTAGAHDRREIEFSVGDFDSAKQFIEALGYEAIFMYEKFRTTYELDGAHIMLDEMPYGNFVEIEGGLGKLKPIAEKLGLNWDAAIPMGYFALFEKVRETRRLNFRDLSFENFRDIKVEAKDLGVTIAN
jgi:adenylate cyclase class 2